MPEASKSAYTLDAVCLRPIPVLGMRWIGPAIQPVCFGSISLSPRRARAVRLLRGTAGVVAYPDFVLFLGFGNLKGRKEKRDLCRVAA